MASTEDARSRPLTVIDTLLNGGAEMSHPKNQAEIEKLPKLLAEAMLTYLNVPHRDWHSDPVQALFSTAFPPNSKKFIVACLVRLLSVCPDAFGDVKLRNRAYELFDAVLGPVMYSRLKIRGRAQTHEKEAALKGALQDAETELEAAVGSLTGLDRLADFERVFFDAYHKIAAEVFIGPFLPKSKLESAIHAIITRASAYRSASPSDVVSSYDAALTAIDHLMKEAQELRTVYSERFIVTPLSKLALRSRTILRFLR